MRLEFLSSSKKHVNVPIGQQNKYEVGASPDSQFVILTQHIKVLNNFTSQKNLKRFNIHIK